MSSCSDEYARIAVCMVPKGAEASTIIYSLVETAKENDLDPYRYLTWLMREATKLDMSDAQQAARLMPVNAPVECRAKKAFDANSTGYVIRFWIISK